MSLLVTRCRARLEQMFGRQLGLVVKRLKIGVRINTEGNRRPETYDEIRKPCSPRCDEVDLRCRCLEWKTEGSEYRELRVLNTLEGRNRPGR